MDFEKDLRAVETNIPGLVVFDLPVHGDNRGWFKENWQRAKQTNLGLPDFGPVQNNISYNAKKGVTRGIHAEPWDKYISIAAGSVFGAWVDLRPGDSFGQVYTTILDPSKAIYVPRGVGNSFQALEDGTVYTYLVNAHWSLEQKRTYTFVNLADPDLHIDWPIPLEESERSEADLHHPMLKDAKPMAPRRTMVTGCNGQLGHAIRDYVESHGLEGFEFNDIDTFDFSDPAQYDRFDWSLYGTIINAGAYTAVDKAETPEGRALAWKANAQGPALLAKVAREHNITLVHVSSDYVFDGTRELHDETESFAPLGVYGQSKAAGDIAVANAPRHYILRSSWVIGEGHNFVKTMMMLSDKVANGDLPRVTVVDDQYGRLTFTGDMADAIFHLLDSNAAYGTYDLTGSGAVKSWADIARGVHYREDVPIRDLFETDLDHMLPLPPSMFDACDWRGVKADRTGTVTIDSNRYLTGPKWHSMRLMAGVRALRVELRSMDGEPIVTLERRWGRSPDTAMDPLSLLAIIARKPRSWGESPIRSDFPEETRVLLDRMEPRERGLLVDDIRHAAVVSGFRAAVMAVVEIVAAGRRPDRAAIDQTARRIAQGDGPESRARLDTYSRFMREDGDE